MVNQQFLFCIVRGFVGVVGRCVKSVHSLSFFDSRVALRTVLLLFFSPGFVLFWCVCLWLVVHNSVLKLFFKRGTCDVCRFVHCW